MLLFDKQSPDAAILEYNLLLQIDPKHIDALRNLGIAYLARGAYKESAETFERILRLEPGNNTVLKWYQEAMRMYHQSLFGPRK